MSSGEYTDKVKKQQQPGEQVDTVNILAEGYPANWQHAVIHLNPETGEMHSGGDSRVRRWLEAKMADLQHTREELADCYRDLALARQAHEQAEQGWSEAKADLEALRKEAEWWAVNVAELREENKRVTDELGAVRQLLGESRAECERKSEALAQEVAAHTLTKARAKRETPWSADTVAQIFDVPTEMIRPCPSCGQTDQGQTGEYPCPDCGLPRLHDEPQKSDERDEAWYKAQEERIAKYGRPPGPERAPVPPPWRRRG